MKIVTQPNLGVEARKTARHRRIPDKMSKDLRIAPDD